MQVEYVTRFVVKAINFFALRVGVAIRAKAVGDDVSVEKDGRPWWVLRVERIADE